MRLIDADALGIGKANPDVFEEKAYALGWNAAIDVINAAATIDAVPVVRCRDCKNSYEDLAGRVCVYGPCVDCIVPDNFYCAYSARMDGDSDAETD